MPPMAVGMMRFTIQDVCRKGPAVKASQKLQKLIAQAVRTSMRIEGYEVAKSPTLQAKAKAIMEAQRVQVSVRGK